MTSALTHRLAEAIDQSICEQVDREAVKAWFSSVSSEIVAVACINALAEPTHEIILAGLDVDDSVQRFWPKMVLAIKDETYGRHA